MICATFHIEHMPVHFKKEVIDDIREQPSENCSWSIANILQDDP